MVIAATARAASTGHRVHRLRRFALGPEGIGARQLHHGQAQPASTGAGPVPAVRRRHRTRRHRLPGTVPIGLMQGVTLGRVAWKLCRTVHFAAGDVVRLGVAGGMASSLPQERATSNHPRQAGAQLTPRRPSRVDDDGLPRGARPRWPCPARPTRRSQTPALPLAQKRDHQLLRQPCAHPLPPWPARSTRRTAARRCAGSRSPRSNGMRAQRVTLRWPASCGLRPNPRGP